MQEITTQMFSGKNVLIVNNDEGLGSLLTYFAGYLGIKECFRVSGEQEAIQFLDKNKDLDVVLTDQLESSLEKSLLINTLREEKDNKYKIILLNGNSVYLPEEKDAIDLIFSQPAVDVKHKNLIDYYFKKLLQTSIILT